MFALIDKMRCKGTPHGNFYCSTFGALWTTAIISWCGLTVKASPLTGDN